jgi:CP family cyanate transporter-like MFS transporter
MTRLLAHGRTSALVLAGIVLLAVNLRPAAVAVGPVLAEVRGGLAMSAASAGLLTSLPVLAFAGFGAAAPTLARRVGVHRATLLALLALVVGLATRALVPAQLPFLALSMLALSGMAVANVLLPSLVKLHFPDRVGTVTALYTGAMSVGLTAALMLTVPISDTFGGWRVGIGAWALPALLAVLPWLWLAGHDRRLASEAHDVRLGDVARTRLGWAMVLFFGLQSMQAYVIFGWFAQLWRDNGYSPTTAGVLVGIVAATSIPLSLWLPTAIARREDQRGLLLAVMACYPVAYLGLIIAPHDLALLWAVIVGIGTCTFPLILTFIGLRSRTPSGTAALSGFTQSAGYLVAAAGPFAIGLLHDATGGWTVPLLVLMALGVPMVAVGLYVARPVYLEDQLPERSATARVAP